MQKQQAEAAQVRTISCNPEFHSSAASFYAAVQASRSENVSMCFNLRLRDGIGSHTVHKNGFRCNSSIKTSYRTSPRKFPTLRATMQTCDGMRCTLAATAPRARAPCLQVQRKNSAVVLACRRKRVTYCRELNVAKDASIMLTRQLECTLPCSSNTCTQSTGAGTDILSRACGMQ